MMNTALRLGVWTVALGAMGFLGTTHAMAQEAAQGDQASMEELVANVDPAEAQALAQQLPDMNWLKVCGIDARINQRVCNIRARELQVEGVTVGAVQIIEVEGGERQIVAIMPTRLQIPDGARGQVDDGGQITGQFRICYPTNCLIEFPAEDATIDAMKAGSEFTITALNEAGRAVPFAFTLAGFTAAYDSDGFEAPLLVAAERVLRQQAGAAAGEPAAADDELQNALERRAQELRERLEQQE